MQQISPMTGLTDIEFNNYKHENENQDNNTENDIVQDSYVGFDYMENTMSSITFDEFEINEISSEYFNQSNDENQPKTIKFNKIKNNNYATIITNNDLYDSFLIDIEKNNYSYFKEFKILIKDILSITSQILLEMIPAVIATIMISHYYYHINNKQSNNDDIYISAIGLATAYSVVTGEGITWGFTSALYTLAPQAIGFATGEHTHLSLTSISEFSPRSANALKQKIVRNALSILLQRSYVLTIIVMIPCAIFQFFSGKFMTLIGEPNEIESITFDYSILLIPWIFGSGLFTTIQRIAQVINLNWLLFSSTLVNCISAVVLMYLFIFVFQLGYIGAAIGISLSFWIMLLFIHFMLFKYDYYYLFDFKLFGFKILFNRTDFMYYLKLSVPTLLQYILEVLIMEMAILLSGYVGDTMKNERTISIAASVIMYNLYIIVYTLAIGISSAVNISVGKYIGANNILYATKTVKLSIVICIFICCIESIILLFGKQLIAQIFTLNKDISDLVCDLLTPFTIFSVFMTFTQLFCGLYRAFGSPTKPVIFELFCYYVISIPLIIVLLFAFKWKEHLYLGSYCIWSCLAIGNVLTVIMCIIYMKQKMDFTKAAQKSTAAIQRIESMSSLDLLS